MKPDDIPQGLWDKAYAVQKSYDERDGWEPTPWDVERHCRIVMEEREACAHTLELVAKTYLPGGPQDAKGGLILGAAAIRNRP